MPLTDSVPSSAFDVLERNIKDTDKFANQETGTFTNRVGKEIKPIPVIEAEANAAVISLGWHQVGLFADGFTYLLQNDIAKDAAGDWYRWNGSLPKVVTAGTLPSSDVNFVKIDYKSHAELSDRNPANGTAHNADDIKDTTNDGSVQDFIDAQYTTAAELATGKFKVGTYVRLTDRKFGIFLIQSGGASDGLGILPSGAGKTAKCVDRVFDSAFYGVIDGSLSNQAPVLNSCISAAISAGASEVILDSHIVATTRILKSSNVRIVGAGSIDSSNSANYLIAVTPRSQPVITEINSGEIDGATNAFQRALRRGALNVVIVGDSIVTQNPDTISGIEDVTTYIESKLKRNLPRVTVNYFNRAIGGSTVESFDAPSLPLYLQAIATATAPWYTNFSLPWFGYVSGLNPDLVILAFGMNGENTTGEYFNDLNSIYTKFQALPNPPALVHLTTPTPTNNSDSAAFSGYGSQALRNHIAELTRTYALATKNYVMDVNRLQQISVNGLDPVNYYKEETSRIQSGEAVIENSLPLVYQTNSRFFSLSLDLKSSATPIQIQFNYNPASSAFNNSVIITSTAITVYTNSRVLQNIAITSVVGQYYEFKIHHDRNRFIVSRDGVNLVDFAALFENYFDSTVLVGGGVLKKNVKLYEYMPKQCAKLLTDDQAWGVYATDSGGTRPLIGGNGVNHPSSIGLNVFYKPVIDEMISKLPNVPQRDTIYNVPASSGSRSLIAGKKFSDYGFCIFVFGNNSLGTPMCQIVPKEVLVAGYAVQHPERNATTITDLINISITSDTAFTIVGADGGAVTNQIGLIIGVV